MASETVVKSVVNPKDTVVEVLSDGSTVVETSTTVESEDDYYVQIQGSDRRYPAIVLRRKHRGEGATILTISKKGEHAELYADYEEAINQYVAERERRIYNSDNRENTPSRETGKGSPENPVESSIDKAIRSALDRPDNRTDNSKRD